MSEPKEPKDIQPRIVEGKPKRFAPTDLDKKALKKLLKAQKLKVSMTVAQQKLYIANFIQEGSRDIEEFFSFNKKLRVQKEDVTGKKGLLSKGLSYFITDTDYKLQKEYEEGLELSKRKVLSAFDSEETQKDFLNRLDENRKNEAGRMAELALSKIPGYVIVKNRHKDKWDRIFAALQKEILNFLVLKSNDPGSMRYSEHNQNKILSELVEAVKSDSEIQKKVIAEINQIEKEPSLSNLKLFQDSEPEDFIRFKDSLELLVNQKVVLEEQRIILKDVSTLDQLNRVNREIDLLKTAARRRITLNERLEEQWQALTSGYSDDVLRNQSLIDLKRGYKDALENEDAAQIVNIERHIRDHLDNIRDFFFIQKQIEIIPEPVRKRLNLDNAVLAFQDSIETELTAKLTDKNIDVAKKNTKETLSYLRNLTIAWEEAGEKVDEEIQNRVRTNFPEIGGDLESEFRPLLRDRLVSPGVIRNAQERARNEAIKEVSKSGDVGDRKKFQELIFTDTLVRSNAVSQLSQGLRAIWKGLGIDETSTLDSELAKTVKEASQRYLAQNELMDKSKQLVYENLANLWIGTQFGEKWLTEKSREKAIDHYIELLKLQNQKVSEAESVNQIKLIEDRKNALRNFVYYSVVLDPDGIKPKFRDEQSELRSKVEIELAKLKKGFTQHYDLLPEQLRDRYEKDLRHLLAHQKSLEVASPEIEDKIKKLTFEIRSEIAMGVSELEHERRFPKLYRNVGEGLQDELQEMRYRHYEAFLNGEEPGSRRVLDALKNGEPGFETALIGNLPKDRLDQIYMQTEVRREIDSLPVFQIRPYTEEVHQAKNRLTSCADGWVKQWIQNERQLMQIQLRLKDKDLPKKTELKKQLEKDEIELKERQEKIQSSLSNLYVAGFTRDLNPEQEKYDSAPRVGEIAQGALGAIVKGVGDFSKFALSRINEGVSKLTGGKASAVDVLIVGGVVLGTGVVVGGGLTVLSTLPGVSLLAGGAVGTAVIGGVTLTSMAASGYFAYQYKEEIKTLGGWGLRALKNGASVVIGPFTAAYYEVKDIIADFRKKNYASAFMRAGTLGLTTAGIIALFALPPTGPVLWGAAATYGVGLGVVGVTWLVSGVGALASRGAKRLANYLKLREVFKSINKETKAAFGAEKAKQIYDYLRNEYSNAYGFLKELKAKKTDKLSDQEKEEHSNQISLFQKYCDEIEVSWKKINSVKSNDESSKEVALKEWKECARMIFTMKQKMYYKATQDSSDALSKQFLTRMRETFVEKPEKPAATATTSEPGVTTSKPSRGAITFGFGKKADSNAKRRGEEHKATEEFEKQAKVKHEKPSKLEKQKGFTSLFSRDKTRKSKLMERAERELDELGTLNSLIEDRLTKKPQNPNSGS